MSTEDRAKATAKNMAGKAQEMVGEITGDPEQKAEGKEKQAEAEANQAVENVKEQAKQAESKTRESVENAKNKAQESLE
jgi:uncharacterized protein YjbJ (UPF0337 family)